MELFGLDHPCISSIGCCIRSREGLSWCRRVGVGATVGDVGATVGALVGELVGALVGEFVGSGQFSPQELAESAASNL